MTTSGTDSEKSSKRIAEGAAIAVVSALFSVLAALAIPPIIHRFSGSQPIELHIETNQDKVVVDGRSRGAKYVIPVTSGRLTAPPIERDSCQGRYDWATSLHGVVAGSALYTLTMSADDKPVTVTNIRPVDVMTSVPLVGNIASCSGGQGGGNAPDVPSTLRLGFNSSGAASLRFTDAKGRPSQLLYSINNGTSKTVNLAISVQNCDCSFKLQVSGSRGDQAFTKTIDAGLGRPFRLTSTESATAEVRKGGRWRTIRSLTEAPAPSRRDMPAVANIAPVCRVFPVKRLDAIAGKKLLIEPRERSLRNKFAPAFGTTPGTIIAISGCNFLAADATNTPALYITQVVAPTPTAAHKLADFYRTPNQSFATTPWRPFVVSSDYAIAASSSTPDEGVFGLAIVQRGRQVFEFRGEPGFSRLDVIEIARLTLKPSTTAR